MAVLAALLGIAAISAHGGSPPNPLHPLHPPHPRIFEQATATVHIVAGARITHGKPPETAMVTETKVNDAQGARRAAQLIEFP